MGITRQAGKWEWRLTWGDHRQGRARGMIGQACISSLHAERERVLECVGPTG
jgi:hypothetical protein